MNNNNWFWRRIAAVLAVTALFVFDRDAAQGQRVLLFEDFEGIAPGPPRPDLCALDDADLAELEQMGEIPEGFRLAEACISAESVDRYNRSRVTEGDNALATVTGGDFPDPFSPGNNQSLVLSNPNQATQMAVNFYSIFPDEVESPNYYLRNGVIQFDVYLETPQPESLFTFLGIRFGFEPDPANKNQVTTTGDQVVWNVFNLFGDVVDDPAKAMIAENVLLQRREPQYRDNLYDQANGAFFVDPAEISGDPEDGLIVAERAIRVRYELTRTADAGSYRVSLDDLNDVDPPVELLWPNGSADRPWTKIFDFGTFMEVPAPGINEISFMTDASALAVANLSQNVYIDNLLIIDNDQVPLDADFDDDDDTDGHDFLRWQAGALLASGATNAMGDTDGDGDVDAADLENWGRDFGAPSGANVLQFLSADAAPEPSAVLMAMFAGCAIAQRRSNRFDRAWSTKV